MCQYYSLMDRGAHELASIRALLLCLFNSPVWVIHNIKSRASAVCAGASRVSTDRSVEAALAHIFGSRLVFSRAALPIYFCGCKLNLWTPLIPLRVLLLFDYNISNKQTKQTRSGTSSFEQREQLYSDFSAAPFTEQVPYEWHRQQFFLSASAHEEKKRAVEIEIIL